MKKLKFPDVNWTFTVHLLLLQFLLSFLFKKKYLNFVFNIRFFLKKEIIASTVKAIGVEIN